MHRSTLLLAALAATAAGAQDYPRLKAGQWDMTITTSRAQSGSAPVKSTMCTDEALQKELVTMGVGMSREMCSKNEFRRDGARWIGNAVCKIGESKIASRSVMTPAGDTAYRTEINATYEPPFMGMKESQTTIEGKWTGPCRDGMAVGDFIGPSGQKLNIKGMAAAAKPPAMPPPQQSAPKAKAPQ
ncbi:MAG: DUF3617 family protein [Burkholderiales bacterium]|nr:DUF3617 family protein [Burkholderiales bacterium]